MDVSVKNVAKVAFVLAFGLATSASAQSFCNATHSGTSTTSSKSYEEGTIGDNGYKIWYDEGNNSATFYSDGSFSCSFSGSKDYLCREGKAYDKTKTWKELGHLYADFSVSMSDLSGIGYSYIGIYGWSVDPLIEWYIVDNWGSKYRPGSWMTKKGEITVDGDTYEVYTNVQNNQPAITGGNATFTQYFSIRNTARSCGTIDISAHFEAWEKMNLNLGKIYEAQILGEGGNTSGGASGKFDFKYAKVYVSDNGGTSSGTSSASVASSSSAVKDIKRQPYNGTAAAIPGTIEAENFDEGNEGVTYSGATGSSGENGNHTYRGDDYSLVDIVGGGTGNAIGYTNKGEWLEYTVNVKESGEYDIVANVSNGSGSGTLELSLDGTALVSLPFTGTTDDWNAYELASGKATLTAGKHTLRITIATASTNVDYVKFTKVVQPSSSTAAVVSSSSIAVVPASSSAIAASSASVPVSSAAVVVTSSAAAVIESSCSTVVPVSSSATVVPESSNAVVDPAELSSSATAPIKRSSSSIAVLPGVMDPEDYAPSSSAAVPTESSSGSVVDEPVVGPAVSSSSVIAGSTVKPVVSSSSAGTVAANPMYLGADLKIATTTKTYHVFGMQGKFLGKVTVMAGASVSEVLMARFNRAGVYLLKNGNYMHRVVVK